MKKCKRFVKRFVKRLKGLSRDQMLAATDEKIRRLLAQGGNRKKLAHLATMCAFIEGANHIAQKMPQRSVVPPADAFAGSTRIQLGA
jgi:hypothetical protein